MRILVVGAGAVGGYLRNRPCLGSFKGSSLYLVFMMLAPITGIGRGGHGKRLRYVASFVDGGYLCP
jgi:hypothetical protein